MMYSMDIRVKCCMCQQETDAELATLIENELIVRELNAEYGHTCGLSGRDIGVLCDWCQETVKGLEHDNH